MIKNLNRKNRNIKLFLAVCLIGSIAGCNKDAPPEPAPANVAAKPATPPAKPVQKAMSSSLHLPPPPVNQFDFSNKKDPFKPFVAIKPAEPAPSVRKQMHDGLPIHQYDVNQFRLIGVVTGSGESKAMVVDPKGKGYVLKLGMTIGKNDGRVTAINASGVSVTEQFKDDNGKVRRENIMITLPRKM